MRVASGVGSRRYSQSRSGSRCWSLMGEKATLPPNSGSGRRACREAHAPGATLGEPNLLPETPME